MAFRRRTLKLGRGPDKKASVTGGEGLSLELDVMCLSLARHSHKILEKDEDITQCHARADRNGSACIASYRGSIVAIVWPLSNAEVVSLTEFQL